MFGMAIRTLKRTTIREHYPSFAEPFIRLLCNLCIPCCAGRRSSLLPSEGGHLAQRDAKERKIERSWEGSSAAALRSTLSISMMLALDGLPGSMCGNIAMLMQWPGMGQGKERELAGWAASLQTSGLQCAWQWPRSRVEAACTDMYDRRKRDETERRTEGRVLEPKPPAWRYAGCRRGEAVVN